MNAPHNWPFVSRIHRQPSDSRHKESVIRAASSRHHEKFFGSHKTSSDKAILYQWLSVRLQYLQCVSNGDTAVLPWAIDMLHGSIHQPTKFQADIWKVSRVRMIKSLMTVGQMEVLYMDIMTCRNFGPSHLWQFWYYPCTLSWSTVSASHRITGHP